MNTKNIGNKLLSACHRNFDNFTQFSHDNSLVGLSLRSLIPKSDAAQLHSWFIMDYACFWSMSDYSVDQVAAFYEKLNASGHAYAWMGTYKNNPNFLIECYDPVFDEVGQHYKVQSGDLGMHLFIGPATTRISGFSRCVFSFVMQFIFDFLGADRIVVEPDERNEKIHALNTSMGFTYIKKAKFLEKTARIALCTRAQFEKSIAGN